MKHLFFIIFTLLSTSLISQQLQSWTLNGQEIDFSAGPIPTTSLSSISGNGETPITNSIHDQNGDMVLFVANNEVYGSNGFIGSLYYNLEGSEIEIFPVPDSPCKYYIVYNFYDTCDPLSTFSLITSKVYYAEVDLQANNGMGIIVSNQALSNDCFPSSGLAISKLTTNNTRYIYLVGSHSELISYEVSSLGISLKQEVSIGDFSGISEVDLSHQGDKLAISSTSSASLSIVHLNSQGEIDASIGNQGNGLSEYNYKSAGVEFSENGEYLFYNDDDGIHQLNLSSEVSQTIYSNIDYSGSQIEMGGDLDLYVASYNNKLGRIKNSNTSTPIFEEDILTGGTINCGNSYSTGISTLPSQVDGADYDTFFENCCLENNIVINHPSGFISCDGTFDEICNPFQSGYSYQWYGPANDPHQLNLLGEGPCFLPIQPGKYVLFVTDQHGCTSSHQFTVFDEIPVPHIGDGGEICEGEIISINGNIFDNPDFIISWYHNNTLVQTGGTTLQNSYIGGYITVTVSLNNCVPVSSTVNIIKCCPKDLFLSVDCENQMINIENLPGNLLILETRWAFYKAIIYPQAQVSTSMNASSGEGTYSVSIIFQLDNGEECEIDLTIEYLEEDCCEELSSNGNYDAIANANFANIEGYQNVNTPYGPMDVPIICDFLLDGSNSLCEEAYYFSVSQIDPEPWEILNTIHDGKWFDGQAGSSIDFSHNDYQQGKMYLLTFNVGPGWNPIYLPFIYGEDCVMKRRSKVTSSVLNNNETITAYPNPAVDQLTIELNFDATTYQVHNVNGQVIINGKLNSRNLTINVSELNQGMYFLLVQDKNNTSHFKKIIKN